MSIVSIAMLIISIAKTIYELKIGKSVQEIDLEH
jgi:hypothetical protein